MTAHAQPACLPVTVLTGFLGSGKSTLLQRILGDPRGERIAVIENEYGEVGIDHDLLESTGGAEEIIELVNGCLCCNVRGDLVRVLGDLQTRRQRGELAFDRVIIETTGLADPGPVIHTLARPGPLAGAYRLDAVITIVDARHGTRTLDEFPEAQRQVGFADRILLSKADLVTADEADRLRARLVAMNPYATIGGAAFGVISIPHLFDAPPAPTMFRQVGSGASHRDGIGSFTFRATRPFDLARLDDFLASMVELYGDDMLRYKGVLDVFGREERVILQGVQKVTEVAWGLRWRCDEPRTSALVFIGCELPRALFEHGLESCLMQAPVAPARDRLMEGAL